jgi:hypothetical protein
MTASPNSIYRRVGTTEFPFSAEDVDDAELSITDAAQDTLLALFAAAINDELTAAFQKVCAAIPALAGKLPVVDRWPGQLTPQVMKERKADFPILAVYRIGTATWTQRTLDVLQLNQEWGIDYVLGPLDTGPLQRVGRILQKVIALLQLVLWQRGHKAYRDGETQFGDANSLQWAFIESHEFGQAKFVNDETGVVYYALSAKMTTVEVDSDVEGVLPDFTGTTFTFGVGGSDGVLPDEIVAVTEVPLQNP